MSERGEYAGVSASDPDTLYPLAIFGADWADALPLEDYDFPEARDTTIGHDVWIGLGALVMPGVTIGHGAIVAAGAIVRADVPPYTIVAGNPAIPVRARFDEPTVARLQALAWWDWPPDQVTRAIPALVKGDVSDLERSSRPAEP